jgi:hypothetical protein
MRNRFDQNGMNVSLWGLAFLMIIAMICYGAWMGYEICIDMD